MTVKTIAIDGSAGCGKSTLGKRLGKKINFFFLDTGILYRAIARHMMNVGVKIYEADAVTDYANTLSIQVEQLRPDFKFTLNETKVSDLYNIMIDKVVPKIAAYPCIREKVREIQRHIAQQGDIILAGRDIGTVVLPDADLKIYLEVSLGERAQRRFNAQNRDKRTLEQVTEDLRLRDHLDSHRDISPMTIAEDAIVIHSDGKQVDEVVEDVLKHIRSVQNS